MTEAHVLNFDLEAEFVPFVLKQCVQQTEAADVVCDFATAEKFLVDRCVVILPCALRARADCSAL